MYDMIVKDKVSESVGGLARGLVKLWGGSSRQVGGHLEPVNLSLPRETIPIPEPKGPIWNWERSGGYDIG